MKKLYLLILCLLITSPAFAFSPAIQAVISAGGATVPECTGLLVCQNFEGTGYDNSETWTSGWNGTPDPDNATSPAPLRGSQSLSIAGATGYAGVYHSMGDQGELYGHFLLRYNADFAGETVLVQLGRTDNYDVPVAKIKTSAGQLIPMFGTQTDVYVAISKDTTYRVWWYFKAATGACDNNGIIRVWLTNTATTTGPWAGTPDAKVEIGDVCPPTWTLKYLDFLNNDTGVTIFVDQVYVKTSTFNVSP